MPRQFIPSPFSSSPSRVESLSFLLCKLIDQRYDSQLLFFLNKSAQKEDGNSNTIAGETVGQVTEEKKLAQKQILEQKRLRFEGKIQTPVDTDGIRNPVNETSRRRCVQDPRSFRRLTFRPPPAESPPGPKTPEPKD